MCHLFISGNIEKIPVFKKTENWNYHQITCLLNEDKDKIQREVEKKELKEQLELMKNMMKKKEEESEKQLEELATLRRERVTLLFFNHKVWRVLLHRRHLAFMERKQS